MPWQRQVLGDGVKARALKDFPGDFSGLSIRIRLMVNISTKPKPEEVKCRNMKAKLSDDDIWNIVNYMRTFKK